MRVRTHRTLLAAAVFLPLVEVPDAEREATAAHAVGLIAATLLCAVALAVLGALLFSRRLLAATEYLGAATEGMAEGRLPPPADLRITGLNKLQAVMRAVSTRLIRTETSRRRHLAEVQAARSAAEAQNRAQDEFLAKLGHELRNPLGAISAAIAPIQMGVKGAQHRIRLVAVTGYGQAGDVRRALAAGFERHLKEPVRLDGLERAAAGLDAGIVPADTR